VKLSISIVSYNTEKYLKTCLESIQKNLKDIEYETIVVDNKSTDESIKMIKEKFPEVHLIENEENLFFAHANNQAIRASKGEYILLLNSDTLISDNSLKSMVLFMEQNPGVGALGGKMLYENGRVQSIGWQAHKPLEEIFNAELARRLFRKKYKVNEIGIKGPKEVDVVSDAFMLVRRKAIFEIGLYDERFKLYYTEDDICHRLKRKRWKVYHFPDASVVHKLFGSSQKISNFRMGLVILSDKIRYYHKYYGLPVAIEIGFFIWTDFIVQLAKGLKRCQE